MARKSPDQSRHHGKPGLHHIDQAGIDIVAIDIEAAMRLATGLSRKLRRQLLARREDRGGKVLL